MRLVTGALLVATSAWLGACGESTDEPVLDDEPTSADLDAVWNEAQPIIEDELAKEDARSAVRFPCTLYQIDEAATLLSTDVDAPIYTHDNKTARSSESDVVNSWQADACSWSSTGEGAYLNVWVSLPEQFDAGKVQCFGMESDDSHESLLGGEGLWVFQKTFAWSRLLVCRDDMLFQVEIHDGPTDETIARDLALQVAERVVEFSSAATDGVP